MYRSKFDEQNPEIKELLLEIQVKEKAHKIILTKYNHEVSKIKLSIEKLRRQLYIDNKEHYYVYVCLVNGEPKYVGMGSGERYKHCQSGVSSCKELNKDFFEFGADNMLTVKVESQLSRERAQYLENSLIAHLIEDFSESLYNKKVDMQGDLDSDGYHMRFWMCIAIEDAKYVGGKPFWWDGMLSRHKSKSYNED